MTGRSLAATLALALACGTVSPGFAQSSASLGYGGADYGQSYIDGGQNPVNGSPNAPDTFHMDETVKAGETFFGSLSNGLATMIERIVARYGEPVGYILGEEGSGAFFGGLRYGDGMLYTRSFGTQPIWWQGPSVGWDFGADGAKVMMLVYRLPSLSAMFQRFGGVNGSAYIVGGFGMTVLASNDTIVVPVRTGIGARLGLNIGYLKFTDKPTWNPF